MSKKKNRGKPKKQAPAKEQEHPNPDPSPTPLASPESEPVADKGESAAKSAKPQDADNESSDRCGSDISRGWKFFFAWANVALALAIMMAAAAEVAVNKWQWETMQTSTSQTDRTLELMQSGQRAWLYYLDPQPLPTAKDFPYANVPIGATISVKNSGKTPGYVIGSISDVWPLYDDSSVPEIQKRQLESARIEVRENCIAADNGINNICRKRALADDDRTMLKAGKKTLYFTGATFYRRASAH